MNEGTREAITMLFTNIYPYFLVAAIAGGIFSVVKDKFNEIFSR